MNRQRKILTVLALAVFGVIIVLHYQALPYYGHSYRESVWQEPRILSSDPNAAVITGTPDPHWTPPKGRWEETFVDGHVRWTAHPFIKDIHMPLFVLAVFYAGLFFLLGDKNKEAR